ncbi:hypothetical protein Chor_008156 [Crotalus horridus]
MRGCWQLWALPWAALALQGPSWTGAGTPEGTGSARRDFEDDVLDLLEALNISRSVPGVSKTQGPDPGIPAWKFRRRVPVLTLPWDYSVYLLSTVQAALGFHFVARQNPGSEGTLISLVSPAASKRDGQPLLQLASSTQADQLWLAYRAVHNMEPASLVFPGSTPFAHGRWAQLALNLEPRRISLYVDCQEPFIFENRRGEELLSLLLPLDLQITFASLAGDESSKFLMFPSRAAKSRGPWLGSSQTGGNSCREAGWSPTGARVAQCHGGQEEEEEGSPLEGAGQLAGPVLSQIGEVSLQVDWVSIGDPSFWQAAELDLFSLPYGLSENQYLDHPEESSLDLDSLPPFEPSALAETHHYQQEPSQAELPPLGSARSGVASLEDRIQRLEEQVEGLGTMLDMVKEQVRTVPEMNSDLRSRLKSLERCECRRVTCFADGQHYEEGASWDRDPCTSCVCAQGKVECQLQPNRMHCQGCVNGTARHEHGEEWTHPTDPCLRRAMPSANGGSVPVCAATLPALARAPAAPSVTVSLGVRGGLWTERGGTRCPRQTTMMLLGRKGCFWEGREYRSGDAVQSQDRCKHCQCGAGEVSCRQVSCPPALCSHPGKRPEQCCPTCDVCEFEGRLYQDRETFSPAEGGPCVQCQCSLGQDETQFDSTAPSPGDRQCVFSRAWNLKMAPSGRQQAIRAEPAPATRGRRCAVLSSAPLSPASIQPGFSCPPLCLLQGSCCPQCHQCLYNQRLYSHSQEFADLDNPCQNCQCKGGTVHCSPTVCPPVTCPHPERRPGSCCPTCPSCLHENQVVPDGEEAPNPLDPCQACVCSGGELVCTPRKCLAPLCAHPLRGSCCQNNCNGRVACRVSQGWPRKLNGHVQCLSRRCPPLLCPEPTVRPQECCPQCPGCLYQGKELPNGEQFADPQDPCRLCSCWEGSVSCKLKACPPAECPFPVPGPCCKSCEDCAFHGVTVASGHSVPDPADPLCSECTCQAGSVRCMKKLCTPANCAHPVPGPCACPLCQAWHGEVLSHPVPARAVPGAHHAPWAVLPPMHGRLPLPGAALQEWGGLHFAPGCMPQVYLSVCQHGGREYLEGTQWLSALDPCQECSCGPGGEASCQPVPCEATLCSHPAPGPCCPLCHDCLFEGERYAHGQAFQPESCLRCLCQDGNVHCEVIACPPATCAHPVTEPGICCPRCKGCMQEGQDRPNGSSWFSPSEPCQACLCADGVVTCTRIICVNTCPAQVEMPGECCPVCADCSYGGRKYGPGESFQPGGDPCEVCTCQDQIQAPTPGDCCPTCAQALSNCTSALLGNQVQATEDPCYTCTCQLGHVECHIQECLPLVCPDGLVEVRVPGQCCAECRGKKIKDTQQEKEMAVF